jgi:hypothetical protein
MPSNNRDFARLTRPKSSNIGRAISQDSNTPIKIAHRLEEKRHGIRCRVVVLFAWGKAYQTGRFSR